MTENVEHIIISHLQALRAGQDRLESEIKDLKHRMNNIESGIARINQMEGANYGEIIQDRHIVDALKERIERIERRLELNG